MASFFCQLNKKENTHCIYVNIKLPDNLFPSTDKDTSGCAVKNIKNL